MPYAELKELRLEDGLDVSRKVAGRRVGGASRAARCNVRAVPKRALVQPPGWNAPMWPKLLVPTCRFAFRHSLSLASSSSSVAQEEYLSEAEFEQVFGMDKEDFRAMPPWKRINAKKAKGLF